MLACVSGSPGLRPPERRLIRRIPLPCCARAASGQAAAPPSSVMNSRRFNARTNTREVFSVEPEDFPAAKHVCESSVDRESKCPISSRQHYCKGLERKVVRKQRKVPQTLSLC